MSVVIPTFGREKELRDTISALLGQPHPRFEIVVADQTPEHEPATDAFLAEMKERIRYFRLPKPGLCAANNFAAAQAKGDVLLFVDDDIVPAADLIGEHARAYADPSVGAVAGRVIDSRNWIVEDRPVGRVKLTGEVVGSWSATRRAEAETVPGGNVSIRGDVFREVGGFPDGYIGTEQFGDSDLGFRVRRAGYRILFIPAAEIFHLRAPAGGCANRVAGSKREYLYYHNALLFALRFLPLEGVLAAIALRWYQGIQGAWRHRKPEHLVLPLIAAAHAAISALRTRRHPPALAARR